MTARLLLHAASTLGTDADLSRVVRVWWVGLALVLLVAFFAVLSIVIRRSVRRMESSRRAREARALSSLKTDAWREAGRRMEVDDSDTWDIGDGEDPPFRRGHTGDDPEEDRD